MTKDKKEKDNTDLTPAELLRREMAKVRRSTTDISAISNTTTQIPQTSPNPVTQLPSVTQNNSELPNEEPVSPRRELPRPHQSTSAGLYSSGPTTEDPIKTRVSPHKGDASTTGKYSYKPDTEQKTTPGTSKIPSILQPSKPDVSQDEKTVQASETSDQPFQLSRRPREGDVDSLFNRLSKKANPNMKLDDQGDPVEKSFERAAELSDRRKQDSGGNFSKSRGDWKPTSTSKLPMTVLVSVAGLVLLGFIISSFIFSPSSSEVEEVVASADTSRSLTGSTSSEEEELYLETTEMPNSPAGEQLMWIVRHINSECSELTEHGLLTHFSRPVVNRVGYDNLLGSLTELGRNNAPYTLRGLVEEPTETEVVGLFDIFGTGKQVLTIIIEPEPPHLILELKVDNWP